MNKSYNKIIELLDMHKVKYEIYEHLPVHTSLDAANIRDTDISIGAKSLLFNADGSPLLFVVPGNERVNTKKIKKDFNIKSLHMYSPEEVFNLTGLKVGSIPPIGKVLDIKSYYSKKIAEKEKVVFNAGMLTVSIKLFAKDLILVENPQIADIT